MANILVVGGAGGVGSAVLTMLVERGDHVVTTVLDEAEASRVRAVHGDRVPISTVDLGDADGTLESLRHVVAAMNGLDAVAVCAAISPNGPVESTPLSVFRRTLEINALADVAIFQACIPAQRRNAGLEYRNIRKRVDLQGPAKHR